jgi:hypothetical protein
VPPAWLLAAAPKTVADREGTLEYLPPESPNSVSIVETKLNYW